MATTRATTNNVACSRNVCCQDLYAARACVDLCQERCVPGAREAAGHGLVQGHERLGGEGDGVHRGHEGEQAVLLHAVVDDGRLLCCGALVALCAHGRVAHGNGRAQAQREGSVLHDLCATQHHRAVRQLGVWRRRVAALARHVCVTHKHVFARDAHTVQAQEAVVVCVAAKLGPDLAHDDALERRVVLQGADGDHERVHAIVAVGQQQTRKHDRVVGRQAKAAGPPLGRRQRRRVHLKLVRLGDERRGGLERADIGPMAEFSLASPW